RERGGAVFRHLIGPAETIPARGARLAVGPLRHDVVVPQQHTVERPRGGDELAAILGEDHAVDQRVDGWVLDAGVVLRAGLIGRRRAPVAALLVPWGQ